MAENQVISVSELTRQIKQQLEAPLFRQIAVEGEISNYKHHSSGHMYFTLKDDKSRIKAVMFRNKNQWLSVTPKSGDTVIAVGSLSVYEPNGEYQIILDRMFPQGVGSLHIEFQRLKERLASKGLFASEAKRALPFLPRQIGVITSPTSAAVRDVLSVIKRRYPCMNVVIIPTVVQGEAGPKSIMDSLAKVQSIPDIDVVILARGGGSIEELWAFNDEGVAQSIYSCPIPIISGVGHETDFTIADFVADYRAPTPSAAAELAVPDYHVLSQQIAGYRQRLNSALVKGLTQKRRILNYLVNRGVLNRPLDRVLHQRQRIDELLSKATLAVSNRQKNLKQQLQFCTGKLESLSPLATLSRGYAVCQESNGTLITNSNQVSKGDAVRVRVSQGSLYCLVEKGEQDAEKERS